MHSLIFLTIHWTPTKADSLAETQICTDEEAGAAPAQATTTPAQATTTPPKKKAKVQVERETPLEICRPCKPYDNMPVSKYRGWHCTKCDDEIEIDENGELEKGTAITGRNKDCVKCKHCNKVYSTL